MTKMQYQDRLNKSPQATNEMLDNFNHNGFVTGSHIVEAETAYSDIDLVVNENCENILSSFEPEGGDYSYSTKDLSCNDVYYFYYERNGVKYLLNILYCRDKYLFDKWEYATRNVLDLCKTNERVKAKVKNKVLRCEFFEHFKRQFDMINQ